MTRRMAANPDCPHDPLHGTVHSEDVDCATFPPCAPLMQAAPRDTQVGGAHYNNGSNLQPWDVIAAWEMDFWEGNVIKYVMRHRAKNGVEDLKKARHYLDYLIAREGDTRRGEAR